MRLFPPGYHGRGMSYGKACTALPEPEAAFSSDDSTKPNHRHSTSGDRAETTQQRGCLCVCRTAAQQADHSMPPTIDFLLCVPIFTWKCNKTVIIPTLPIFRPDNPPPPHPLITTHPLTPQAAAAQAAIWREADHRLSAPGSSHSWHSGTERERESGERDRDEREEELMKEGRMAKEMCGAVER